MNEEFSFRINKLKLVQLLALTTVIFGLTSYKLHCADPEGGWSMLKSVIDEILGSIFVAFFISFIFLFLKTEEDKEQIKILETINLDKELNISRKDTQSWYFTGGTGTETRNVSLPVLGNAARTDTKIKNIKIQILYPTNVEICKKYCEYRVKSSNSNEWTIRNIQLKLYATILACVYWSKNSPLNIEIYLKDTFSTFRYDISDDRIIITKEDPKESAFLIEKPNPFFHSIVEEFYRTIELFKKVELSSAKYPFRELTLENQIIKSSIIKQMFQELGLKDEFSDEEIEYIVNQAKPIKKKNRN